MSEDFDNTSGSASDDDSSGRKTQPTPWALKADILKQLLRKDLSDEVRAQLQLYLRKVGK